MKKFEYKVVQITTEHFSKESSIYSFSFSHDENAHIKLLNKMGDQGWELIINDGHTLTFIREKLPNNEVIALKKKLTSLGLTEDEIKLMKKL